MDGREVLFERRLLLRRHRAIDEVEEVETEPDVVDPDQLGDVGDLIHVRRGARALTGGAQEHRADPDHATSLGDRLHLRVAAVPLDVVEAARVGVADHQRPVRPGEHVVHAGGVQVREVDQDPQLLARIHDGAPERRETLRRRAARRDQPAVAREVAAHVGEADATHAELMEGAEQVDVRPEWLDALHREEDPDAAVCSGRFDLGAVAADGEAGIVRDLLVEQRKLVDRDAKRELRQVAVVEVDRGADEPDPAVVELLPEVTPEEADRLVLVDALLVEVEQQVEVEIDDVAHRVIMAMLDPSVRRAPRRRRRTRQVRLLP
ncbi:MAG TPA: hypothetical protein VLK36_14305 [Gaiellaceae bacterium]|nr:hypothetical protein [Gaiellaceae bacterium]